MTEKEEKKIREIQDFVREKGMEGNYLLTSLMSYYTHKYDKVNAYYKSILHKYFVKKENNSTVYVFIKNVEIESEFSSPFVDIEEVFVRGGDSILHLEVINKTLCSPTYERFIYYTQTTKEEFTKAKEYAIQEIEKINNTYKEIRNNGKEEK